ncbi:MAG: DNA mismatch endonuclease Vsr [Actinobacteria bacterium]|nr:DNA mismatch endonuclease Vsr [Actinomycetota bacterium]
MRANRRRDTTPEMALRRALHAAGLRFRVDVPLPFDRRRRADVVFPRQKIAIFIDGCFWHRCPEHYTSPKANSAFWAEKAARNVELYHETNKRLEELGWTVLRFWEHQDLAGEPVHRVIEVLRLAES